MEVILQWAGPFAALLSIATVIYTALTAGSKANSDRIVQVEAKLADGDKLVHDKITDHDRRIQAIESELKHMPDKDQVVDLRLTMAEISQKVAVMGENVSATSRTVRRIDDYLHKRDREE